MVSSGSTVTAILIFFFAAIDRTRVFASSSTVETSKSTYSSSIFPASTFERSSMLLMSCSRCLPLVRMFFAYFDCFSLRAPNVSSCRISEKPMIEFSGVRSSWLMFARNSDFVLLAVASSCDVISSSSRWFLSLAAISCVCMYACALCIATASWYTTRFMNPSTSGVTTPT